VLIKLTQAILDKKPVSNILDQ